MQLSESIDNLVKLLCPNASEEHINKVTDAIRDVVDAQEEQLYSKYYLNAKPQ